MHARVPRGPYWAAGPDPVTAGLFNSKTIPNLASKQTCEFNIKFCRNPKIVKLILFGFYNYDLPASVLGSHGSKIFHGCFKCFNML